MNEPVPSQEGLPGRKGMGKRGNCELQERAGGQTPLLDPLRAEGTVVPF